MVILIVLSLFAAREMLGAVSVFEAVDGAATAPMMAARPEVVRAANVRVQFAHLAAVRSGDKLSLALFPDTTLTGVVERAEQRELGTYIVAGRISDSEFGTFLFVVEQDVLVGRVQMPNLSQMFAVRFAGAGVHTVAQIDLSRLPSCGGVRRAPDSVAVLAHPTPTELHGGRAGTCMPAGTVIDVMIVYTPLARQAAGGTSAINALCMEAIELNNLAYENSGIGTRHRLVHRSETSYDESDDYRGHLDRLTDSADGSMDEIHALRDTYGVDLVALLVNDDEFCGLAWCSAHAGSAFSVTSWFCILDQAYAHECGHNMGCAHDRDNNNGECPEYAYSFGWRFSGDTGLLWRTVMAYPPGWPTDHFSNPGILFDGQPTGVPLGDTNESHNALTISNRSGLVETFRQTRSDIWIDFGFGGGENGSFAQPYNTAGEGQSNVINGNNGATLPSLWFAEGVTSETLTFSVPMTIRSCGGPATIGRP